MSTTYDEYIQHRQRERYERGRLLLIVIGAMFAFSAVVYGIGSMSAADRPKPTPAQIRARNAEVGVTDDGRSEPAAIANDLSNVVDRIIAARATTTTSTP